MNVPKQRPERISILLQDNYIENTMPIPTEQFSWKETTDRQLRIFEALRGVNDTYPHSHAPDYAAQVKVSNNKFRYEHEKSGR
jgi:hypothetical protein